MEDKQPHASESNVCQKCGYMRTPADNAISSPDACPKCGLLYAKAEEYLARKKEENEYGTVRQIHPHITRNENQLYAMSVAARITVLLLFIGISAYVRAYLMAKVYLFSIRWEVGTELVSFPGVFCLVIQCTVIGLFVNDAFLVEQINPEIKQMIKFVFISLIIALCLICLHWILFMDIIGKEADISFTSSATLRRIAEFPEILKNRGKEVYFFRVQLYFGSLVTLILVPLGACKFYSLVGERDRIAHRKKYPEDAGRLRKKPVFLKKISDWLLTRTGLDKDKALPYIALFLFVLYITGFIRLISTGCDNYQCYLMGGLLIFCHFRAVTYSWGVRNVHGPSGKDDPHYARWRTESLLAYFTMVIIISGTGIILKTLENEFDFSNTMHWIASVAIGFLIYFAVIFVTFSLGVNNFPKEKVREGISISFTWNRYFDELVFSIYQCLICLYAAAMLSICGR